MTFGKKLKRLLEERNITQTKLAEILNCRQSIISRWIKGISANPKKETIDKLANALNVSPSYFIDEGQKNFIKNSGTIGAIGNNNSVNMEEKIKDHEIRILQLEKEILKLKIKK